MEELAHTIMAMATKMEQTQEEHRHREEHQMQQILKALGQGQKTHIKMAEYADGENIEDFLEMFETKGRTTGRSNCHHIGST